MLDSKTKSTAKPPKQSSMERVLEYLRKSIHGGRIVPGQRLVTAEVASDLGVSPAPVREAFHLLAGEGLLELMQNRGARVRTLTTQDLLEGVQVLKKVSALAFELAAERPSDPEQLAELEAILRRILAAGEKRDAKEFFQAVSESHRKVNEIAGNSYLNPVVSRLHLEYFNAHLSEILPGNWERYIENYRRLGELFLKGPDHFDQVNAGMGEHFDWVMSLLQERIAKARKESPEQATNTL